MHNIIMAQINNRRFLIITRVFLCAIPALILLFVLNQRFVPFGKITETYNFKKPGVIISALSPKSHVETTEKNLKTKEYYQRVIEDPVYFDVTLPFAANFIDLDIKYQNPNAPLVQLGIITKEKAGKFVIEPIENKYVENSDWIKEEIPEKGIIFLQKPVVLKGLDNKKEQGEYANFADFEMNFPKDRNVAFYQIDPTPYYEIDNYQPLTSEAVWEKTLRGSHELVVYIDNEDLDFTFYYQKRNDTKADDNFNIQLLKNDEIIQEWTDEKEALTKSSEGGKSLQVLSKNLPAGIYDLRINAGSNTQIKKIDTKQKYWGFKDHLLLDNPAESLLFYSNSVGLAFKADHSSGLQTINIDKEELEIDALHKNFGSKPKQGLYQEVFIPRDDILVKFLNIITFKPEDLDRLIPSPKAIDLEQISPLAPVTFDFIVAKYYVPLQETNGWKTFKKTLTIDDLFVKDNKIQFMLSAPGVKNYQGFKISQIKVTLRKN